MLFGLNPFASIGFASSTIDESVASTAVDLVADQEAARSFLFHATPYDTSTASETDVRASIGLAHPIVDDEHWPAYLKNACDSNVDLFGDDESAQGRTSFGNLELLIGDGAHDDLAAYAWDGRDVDVKLGAEGFAIDEYITVLKGTAEGITYDRRRLGIVFRGKETLLDKDIQETTYTGVGGLEGDATLEGNEKPLVYGAVTNITPIQVDSTNLVYQFHDGSAESAVAFDGGLALDSAGDVADITAASVEPGYYKTQLDSGYIKLGAPPSKLLTLDVQGDNSGDGYVSNAAHIIKRIVIDRSDLTASDLNLPSFYTAHLDSSRSVSGVYITGGTIASVVKDLMHSIGGAWTFNRVGLLTIAVLRKRFSSGTITEDDIVEDDIVKGSFKRVRTVPPSWRRRIGSTKSWTVHNESQFVGAATSARRTLTSREYQYSTNETASIKERHLGARVVVKDTLLSTSADADTENARQQALYGATFDRIDITTRRQQFRYQIGQTITLDYDRFGIDADMIILGIRENTTSGRTTFRLLMTDNEFTELFETASSATLVETLSGESLDLG